jgi:pectate lyase
MSANCCYAFTGRFRATPVTNLKNIEFKNLSFQMPVTPHDAAGGGIWFQEQLTLFIDSVENCLIENCQFIRWSGDSIMLGAILVDLASPFAAGIVKNVHITECLFDGVDKDNRNSISILDGVQIEIDNNIFLNCSRTDMPGAIDVEPENIASVLENISIHNNKFTNIGGGVAAVGFALGTNLTTPAKEFSVHNNQFKDCTSSTIFTTNGKSSADPLNIAVGSPQRISFTNNKIDGLNYSDAFSVRGCDEITISDNIFSNFIISLFIFL